MVTWDFHWPLLPLPEEQHNRFPKPAVMRLLVGGVVVVSLYLCLRYAWTNRRAPDPLWLSVLNRLLLWQVPSLNSPMPKYVYPGQIKRHFRPNGKESHLGIDFFGGVPMGTWWWLTRKLFRSMIPSRGWDHLGTHCCWVGDVKYHTKPPFSIHWGLRPRTVLLLQPWVPGLPVFLSTPSSIPWQLNCAPWSIYLCLAWGMEYRKNGSTKFVGTRNLQSCFNSLIFPSNKSSYENSISFASYPVYLFTFTYNLLPS